jgi:hypothetical protein
MTTKKKIVWRLQARPTVDELRDLVKDKIIDAVEAREILFTSEEVEDRDKKSLESEIKFLRDLVEQLSKNSNKTIYETIRVIEQPYYKQPWYRPYDVWCINETVGSQPGGLAYYANQVDGSVNSIQLCNNSLSQTTNDIGKFTSIKTF